jgi:hypothetical protein
VFFKLLLMVLSIGATACTLLVMRQQRLDLLAAQTATKQRIIDQSHVLRSLRFELEQSLNEELLWEWIRTNGGSYDSIPFELHFDAPLELPAEVVLGINR